MKEKSTRDSIRIYTDGSCDPNPGPGGWAAILIDDEEKTIIKGTAENSTNNRMEMTAALEALRSIDRTRAAKIYTDSQYLQKGVLEWLPDWKARNWKRKGGKLANIDLWKALDAELAGRKISWKWIKGHAGHPYNESVDRLARGMIRK